MSKYSELLSTNIELLFMKYPPLPSLQEQLRKNLFLVPNQRASDELIRYLFSIIDKRKYTFQHTQIDITLNKKLENSFYTLVHKFSKEISDEYPEENLPKVAKSFFLMPSGEKYVHYMYKLTQIAMKNDVKAAGITMCQTRMPKDDGELKKLKAVNDKLDEHIKAQMESALQLHVKNKNRERLLKSQIQKNQKVLMDLKAELKLKVEKCSLPEHEKRLIVSGDDEVVQEVMKEWSSVLSQRGEKLEKNADVIKETKRKISQLHKAVTLKRNKTLGNKDELTGLSPEDYVNNLLRRAKETLNTLHLKGPADVSPYISSLEYMTKQFKDLLGVTSNFSQIVSQIKSEVDADIPQLEAAFYSNDQLETKNTEEEEEEEVDAGCEHSLINMLCKSTPPELLRNLRIAELKSTPVSTNSETESLNASGMDAVSDMADGVGPHTPVAIDKDLLKPVCFESKCVGSTWKHALLLSTLKKKKKQQKQNTKSDFENIMGSPERPIDTAFSQSNKKTTNPVKSLNNLWTDNSTNESDNSRNYCVGKKILHAEFPSDDESPGKSSSRGSSAAINSVRTEWRLLGLPDSSLRRELLRSWSGISGSETMKPSFIQEQNKAADSPVHLKQNERHSSEEDSAQYYEVITSGNMSQGVQSFIQGLTNSHGSFIGPSSAFESSSSLSPPSDITGTHMHTSLDFVPTPPYAIALNWNDEKDLKRILNVALSPVGISAADVRSSTPINSSSSQPELTEYVKQDVNPLKPATTTQAVSRIPRIKSLGCKQLKQI